LGHHVPPNFGVFPPDVSAAHSGRRVIFILILSYQTAKTIEEIYAKEMWRFKNDCYQIFILILSYQTAKTIAEIYAKEMWRFKK